MRTRTQIRLEWGLLGIVAALCGGLSCLQYRWTGELSRAERSRLHGGLERQSRQIVQAFDGELRAARQGLVPEAREIRSVGLAAACEARYRQWLASRQVAGLFARVGVAVAEGGALDLHLIDSGGKMAAADWPRVWRPLRNAPRTVPADSDLVVTPVFDVLDVDGRRVEAGWLILEPDRDFIRRQLMPKMAAEFLNPDAEPEFDMSVSRASASGDVIFSTRPDGAPVLSHADITASLFGTDTGRPEWEQRRDGGRESRASNPRWVLAIRHRAGSLDAAVGNARSRNLFTSFLLVGLLAGTALLLVRLTARSCRLSDMQFRFAAGISHDLRTPLTAIRGAAFNLVCGVVRDPAATEGYAKLILRNSEELSAMVDNVLAYTAARNTDAPELRDPVDVSGVLERTAATMLSEINAAGCRLELDMEPGLPLVRGDGSELERAFRNLVCNAVRHGADGGWIGVAGKTVNGGIEVKVCDRGPGIPEREQAEVFAPFFRGERAKEQRISGTGLGLSLVRATVQRHGGTIALRSGAGAGAEWTVWLPGSGEA